MEEEAIAAAVELGRDEGRSTMAPGCLCRGAPWKGAWGKVGQAGGPRLIFYSSLMGNTGVAARKKS